MMKKIILILFLFIILVPTCCANEHIFYDSDVLVIGKCRTIFSSIQGPWLGGLLQGYLPYVGMGTDNEKGETVRVFISNNSSLVYKCHSSDITVFTVDSTGTFFWRKNIISFNGLHFSFFCPFIFIRCHSKIVRVVDIFER